MFLDLVKQIELIMIVIMIMILIILIITIIILMIIMIIIMIMITILIMIIMIITKNYFTKLSTQRHCASRCKTVFTKIYWRTSESRKRCVFDG